jgi:hypothetical protein
VILGAGIVLAITVGLPPQVLDTPPPAIVAGRVVDAVTGRPIAGAVITTAGSAVAQPGASGTVRVITNTGGGFVLRGVSKGSLVLTVAKGGYVDAQPGQRRPGGSVQPIRVADGQRIADVEIRMWRFASISGAVVDEGGDPAVNTRVQVLQRTYVAGRPRFAAGPVAATDDRGVYRIAGLMPGEYCVVVPSKQTSVPAELMDAFFTGTPLPRPQRLQVSRELNAIGSSIAPSGSSYVMRAGGQALSLPAGTLAPVVTARGTIVYPTVYYPLATSLAEASVLTLRAGEERAGIDIQVRPVRGVRVSGTLLGPENGTAITGVRLVPARDSDALSPIEAAATITDWTGAFTFAAVPPGQYVLRVLKLPRSAGDNEDIGRVMVTPGGTMTISSNPGGAPAGPPPIPADATLGAQMPLVVGDAEIHDLLVPLSPAARISGRLEFQGTNDRPSPEQIAGLRIALDTADGPRGQEPLPDSAYGRPDPSGEFRTYGVPPGRYVLRVSPLTAGWHLQSAMFQGRDIADLPIDIEARDITGVVITFTDRPAGLTGMVSGAQGADAAAVVIAYPTDDVMWTTSPRRMRTARAAADGSFAIQSLPSGEYFVVAVDEDRLGEWQDPALLRALAPLAQTVRLVDGEQKTVNLRAATIK